MRALCASLQENLEEKTLRLKQAEVEIASQANQIKEMRSISALNDSLNGLVSSLQDKVQNYEQDRLGMIELLRSLGVPESSIPALNQELKEQPHERRANNDRGFNADEGKSISLTKVCTSDTGKVF